MSNGIVEPQQRGDAPENQPPKPRPIWERPPADGPAEGARRPTRR
jgi:hypothetical protein